MSDWLDDLGEFPAVIVAEACQVWRRTQTHRPTPADIRARCLDLQREAEERAKPKPLHLPAPEASKHAVLADRFSAAADARETWARQHGCEDFAEAMRAGLQAVARRTPA